MNFSHLLKNHRTCKLYHKIIDDDQKITSILEAAQYSVTSFNFQPTKYIVLKKGCKHWNHISKFCWNQLNEKNASYCILLVAKKWDYINDNNLIYKRILETRQLDEKTKNLYKKLVVHWINYDYGGLFADWSHRQSYISLANMINQAIALNLGYTPMEGIEYNNLNKYLYANKLMNNEYELSVGLLIGDNSYPQGTRIRRSLKEIVLWDH